MAKRIVTIHFRSYLILKDFHHQHFSEYRHNFSFRLILLKFMSNVIKTLNPVRKWYCPCIRKYLSSSVELDFQSVNFNIMQRTDTGQFPFIHSSIVDDENFGTRILIEEIYFFWWSVSTNIWKWLFVSNSCN